jgi:hypothetical protein
VNLLLVPFIGMLKNLVIFLIEKVAEHEILLTN